MDMRRATLAGRFYPGEPASLKEQLDYFFSRVALPHPVDACGIVSPHAGTTYSGQVAAYSYSAVPENFEGTFIVIAPSHAGYPDCTSGLAWETPLGVIECDVDLVSEIDIRRDDYAHALAENSLEVQMPFIKYRFPGAKVVPVLMGRQTPSAAKNMADGIVRALRDSSSEVRVVASSDFSHYIPDSEARRLDAYAIEAVLKLDSEEFFRIIKEEGISACGYGPITVMIDICRELFGAEKGEMLKYMTSGDVSGDFDQVVGYAAIAVF
ncbi:MAG: AmmeMemoRadiSam system protein B [Methanomicrobiaceae archaeon]|nr:AmmeMemoRadiSam system protein B [Methanomicrobiaceae archaeon]